jgi:hypothetical protein
MLILASPAFAGTPTRVRVPGAPPPLPASGAERAKAEKRVRKISHRAERDLTNGRAGEALAKAEQILEILPDARASLFRADILRQLGRACEAFDAVLLARDLHPTSEQEREIAQSLAEDGPRCEPGFGWATISLLPGEAAEKAALTVSGTPVSPGRTVGLGAGKHRIEVKAPGYRTARTTVTAVAGAEAAARVELVLLPPEPPAPPPPVSEPPVQEEEQAAAEPPSPEPSVEADASAPPPGPPYGALSELAEPARPNRLLAWSLVGGGAALVAAGVVLHVKAFDAVSQANDVMTEGGKLRSERPQGWTVSYGDLRGRHEDAASDAMGRQTAAFVLYGAGAAVAAAGTVLFLLEPAAEPATFVLRPVLSPSGSGLAVRGGF